ncbi:hypothetical protein D018_3135B, partial [Vibrio parahaemolyticus VP2007-007]
FGIKIWFFLCPLRYYSINCVHEFSFSNTNSV